MTPCTLYALSHSSLYVDQIFSPPFIANLCTQVRCAILSVDLSFFLCMSSCHRVRTGLNAYRLLLERASNFFGAQTLLSFRSVECSRYGVCGTSVVLSWHKVCLLCPSRYFQESMPISVRHDECFAPPNLNNHNVVVRISPSME